MQDRHESSPDECYLRIWQIIGGKGYRPIIPVSKTSWWRGVKEERYPHPIKLGKRTTVWRERDILALIK